MKNLTLVRVQWHEMSFCGVRSVQHETTGPEFRRAADWALWLMYTHAVHAVLVSAHSRRHQLRKRSDPSKVPV